MKINQKGFGLVEGLLITIVVLLIGFASYYAWSMNQDDELDPSAAQDVSIMQSTEPEKEDFVIPEGWVEYSNNATGVSFFHPAEWGEITLKETPSSLEGKDGLKYEGSFSGNSRVIVSYSETDYGLLGGGCALNNVHIINSIPVSENVDRYINAKNVRVAFNEETYSTDGDSGCVNTEDYDKAVVATNADKFPAFGLIFNYKDSRDLNEQNEFISVVETISVTDNL